MVKQLVNRFGEWMGEGLEGDFFGCLGRFVVIGVMFVAFLFAIVLVVSLFAGEPVCESGTHRWHTTVGKTTISKCLPDRETGI